MTPDKKIEEYLERAKNILKPYDLEEARLIIEIAKMIQLEEHREHVKDGMLTTIQYKPPYNGTGATGDFNDAQFRKFIN